MIRSGLQPAYFRQALGRSAANAVTLLALAAGFLALLQAAEGAYALAILCVIAAAILDACDGRVARSVGSPSRFGAELDSLSDVVCFGAVPAFILHQWSEPVLGHAALLPSLALASACALRLARFNVMSLEPGRPPWTKAYFTGVPAPAGAFLALFPLYLELSGHVGHAAAAQVSLASGLCVAALMASRVPTYSGKGVPPAALRRWFVPLYCGALLFAGGLVEAPWATIALAASIYCLIIPLSARSYRLRARGAADIG